MTRCTDDPIAHDSQTLNAKLQVFMNRDLKSSQRLALQMKTHVLTLFFFDMDFGLSLELLLFALLGRSVNYQNDFGLCADLIISRAGRDALGKFATMVGIQLPAWTL